MDHFIGALGLDASYSVLLLNPTWHVEEPVYGYRMGVSSEELQLVKGQQERLRATIVGPGGARVGRERTGSVVVRKERGALPPGLGARAGVRDGRLQATRPYAARGPVRYGAADGRLPKWASECVRLAAST